VIVTLCEIVGRKVSYVYIYILGAMCITMYIYNLVVYIHMSISTK